MIFVIIKMAATAILDFQKFEILTVSPLYVANVRQRAKFLSESVKISSRNMAI